MEEVFREYGGAVLSMMGTIAAMEIIIGSLFFQNSTIATILEVWGLGGV